MRPWWKTSYLRRWRAVIWRRWLLSVPARLPAPPGELPRTSSVDDRRQGPVGCWRGWTPRRSHWNSNWQPPARDVELTRAHSPDNQRPPTTDRLVQFSTVDQLYISDSAPSAMLPLVRWVYSLHVRRGDKIPVLTGKSLLDYTVLALPVPYGPFMKNTHDVIHKTGTIKHDCNAAEK